MDCTSDIVAPSSPLVFTSAALGERYEPWAALSVNVFCRRPPESIKSLPYKHSMHHFGFSNVYFVCECSLLEVKIIYAKAEASNQNEAQTHTHRQSVKKKQQQPNEIDGTKRENGHRPCASHTYILSPLFTFIATKGITRRENTSTRATTSSIPNKKNVY